MPAVQNITPRDLTYNDVTANGKTNTDSFIRPSDGKPYTSLPEGTESFILGPLVGNYAINHGYDDFTNLGYIQKDTRQFVLLGRIQGYFDGTAKRSGNARTFDGTASMFTSFNSNFKLEHALWMKDTYLAGNFVDNFPFNFAGGIPVERHPDDNTMGSGSVHGTNEANEGGENDNIGTPQDPPDDNDIESLNLWGILHGLLATGADFLNNPLKYAIQGLLNLGGLLTGQDGLATSFNNLVHHTNNNNPLHPDFRKNDPSSDNYEGPAEVQTSDENRQNIVNALNDSISNLNGGKGPRNPNGNLYDDEIEQVSKDMKNNYYNDQTNQAYNTFYNSFHSLPTGGDRGDGKPVTTIKVNNGEFEKLDSNYWFTDPRDANPLASDESIPSNDKQLPSTVISNIIHGVENQATGNGVWTPGSDGNPFYSDETKTTVVGTQYNTQQSFSAKPPKSNKNVKESYITESVRLGFFEPKIMDVNLADIKNGIMPEYPKKPPAKMIDGYHEKSRIRSREAKNIIPTLKIDKVDLIRNHRLKPSEADEMMNTIKMINDYIKKHPEDFIHAQMRYPVDDPRLAELNWKMDQMLDAGKEYLDSNFKENQTLFKRATERTKRNTALTNPDYIQKHYDELRGTIKTEPKPTINRKSPSRFFKKPKKKSSMEAINDKIKQLDKDLLI